MFILCNLCPRIARSVVQYLLLSLHNMSLVRLLLSMEYRDFSGHSDALIPRATRFRRLHRATWGYISLRAHHLVVVITVLGPR